MKEKLTGLRGEIGNLSFVERREAKKQYASLISAMRMAEADLTEFDVKQRRGLVVLGETKKGHTPCAQAYAESQGYDALEARETERPILVAAVEGRKEALEIFLRGFPE